MTNINYLVFIWNVFVDTLYIAFVDCICMEDV